MTPNKKLLFPTGRYLVFGIKSQLPPTAMTVKMADRVERDDLLAGAKDFGSGFAVAELGAADIAQINGDAVANGDDDVLHFFG